MESTRALYTAIGANVVVATAKFIAAGFTGSSSMLAEGIHTLTDTSNGLLVLWGRHRSRCEPDRLHPFGYGMELYFWSFMVAVLIFSLGGGVTVYQGVSRVLEPEPIEHPAWNYVVLAVALISEGYALFIASRQLR